MEWTREKTLQLISAYRERRGLWDMTCDDYRKKDVKLRLLTEVQNNLIGNIPIPELEKKFHTLRTQYHREISRMKRKEPYNSKWFGFKNLQFLSSPRACRSNKGRVKSEITEDGTVTKYVIAEQVTSPDNSGEEYLTVTRKSHAHSRAQELEKLIEETTKDVEDIEDAKPKLIMKEVTVPFEQNYTEEVQVTESENVESQHSQHHHHHHNQQQAHQSHHAQPIEDVEQSSHIETVSFQANENGELHYQTTPNTAANSTSVHQHVLPARIFKLPRREVPAHEESYYTEGQAQQQQHLQPAKRIYYEANTHNTTILTTPTLTSPPNGTSTIINTSAIKLPRGTVCVGATPPKLNESPTSITLPAPRDEFATYGEYVANEMRAITNREVLIALKHKINTAIFEANMAELQK